MTDSSRSPTPRRILVVEGHDDCRDSLVALVAMQGYEVQAARDGAEAVDLALQFRPHVVLLDLGLPTMSGHDVARALRGMPATADTFIAAVTGYGSLADRQRAAAAGIDLHLVKPVSFDDLLPALQATRRRPPGGGEHASQ